MHFFQQRNFKKNIAFLCLVLVIFSFLFFPFSAQAFIQQVEIWFANLPARIIGAFLALIISLARGIAIVFGALLDWVTSPGFIAFSYTGTDNPVIKVGLNITQGLVNIAIVAALIYVALSIALRLTQETEAKKMFARLIVIALLVNFAPVFCGLIVDAANIVMNYFLQGIKEGISGILTQAKTYLEALNRPVTDMTDVARNYELLVVMTIHIMTNLAIAFTFLLFAALFFIRYLAIWIAVILSPLAFVAWIAPPTKRFWNLWWNNFIQWVIIGIPAAFFLWLGMRTFAELRVGFIEKITTPGVPHQVVGAFGNVLPFAVTVVFLFLGFLMTTQISALGAQQVMGFTKKTGKWAEGKGKWAAGKAWAGAKYGGRKVREKIPEKVQKFGERQATAARWGEGQTGIKGWGKRTISAPFYHSRREFGKMLSTGLVESQKTNIAKMEANYKGKEAAFQLSSFHRAGTDAEKISILNAAIEDRNFSDLMDKKKFDTGALNEKEVKRLMSQGQKWESHKKLQKAAPHLIGITDDEKNKGITREQKIADVLKKMSGADYKNITNEALEDIKVVALMLENAMGHHIRELIESKGQMAAQAIQKSIDEQVKTGPLTITESLEKYLRSNIGQSVAVINLPDKKKIKRPSLPPPSTEKAPSTLSRRSGTIGETLKKRKTE